ncbi:metal ABC transporter permease [Limibaculum sp. FT325]|uniref:metal ABC transporter permease n=1 Tax=Thermohalobaculum sediminis TaxID=2939436 RepID=UPI0020C0E5F8|nr:metal ABC transporter permease [Limibaculum sediminis]MCL5779059.1 metal ABC transporter permease [Limibaculum sediminis]
MLDDFMIRAALAGIGVALAAGPLGCFVVWRRMAYFGDATAHASLLGVALALASDLPVLLGVLGAALATALVLSARWGGTYAADTLLGVVAHASLALGLVAVSFLHGVRIDLMGYLFGDILAVTRADLAVIWAGALAVAALLVLRWRGLMTATLSPDLAFAEGRDPERERLVLTVALALLVAVAIKVVGALLITAMLIVPAAAARGFARTPEGMAALAALIGAGAVIAGVAASFRLDTPAGPSIVVAAVAVFLAAALAGPRLAERRAENGRVV